MKQVRRCCKYVLLHFRKQKNQYREHEPLDPFHVEDAAISAYKVLIEEEAVVRAAEFIAPEVNELRSEVIQLYSDANRTQELLTALNTTSQEYAEKYGAKR